MKRLWSIIKRYFISGVLVVVPLIVTAVVLRFLFEAVDGVLGPVINKIFGYYVPGLGILATILLIFVVGILTRNFLGDQLVALGDRLLERLPLIRPIYASTKQLLKAMTQPNESSFKEVVLVEYPRKGLWSVGFITNRLEFFTRTEQAQLVAVFIPSPPTPLSGMIILVPAEDILLLDMNIEGAMKFMVSLGVAAPDKITAKNLILAEVARREVRS